MSKCKICRSDFQKRSITHRVCSYECSLKLVILERQKREKKELRHAIEKLKTKSDWAREAQQVFNQYVRLRDEHLPCISCGRFHIGQMHSGHYLTVGAHPELRFNEDNVNKQCAPCNNHLSGNIVNYRRNLINKIGLDKVEWLEGNHDAKHYSIDDLKAIKAEYKLKLKQLREEGNNNDQG